MALLIDGLIILLYFVAITSIGLYMGRREKSLHDFALGGRRVPWWAVMASIIAAETSAATFLGAPGEGYTKKSFAYVQLVLGLIIGRVIVGHVFLKPYFTYKVYTVYDYLGVRFGPLPVHAHARVGHAALHPLAGDGAGLAHVPRRRPGALQPAGGHDGRPLSRRDRPAHDRHVPLHRRRRHQGRHLDRRDPGVLD